MAPHVHPMALSSCSSQRNVPLPSAPSWSEHVAHITAKLLPVTPGHQWSTSATEPAVTVAGGQATVLRTGHLISPRATSKHHCVQIRGSGPFYAVSHSIHAPAKLNLERFYNRLDVSSCRKKEIAASSAPFSHSLCIGIHELLLLFIFLIKVKSLALAEILPLD